SLFLLSSLTAPPPPSPLFPSTTLFRSRRAAPPPRRRRSPRPCPRRTSRRCRSGGCRVPARAAALSPRPPAPSPARPSARCRGRRSEEHTSELQSLTNLVCRLLLEKKNH